MSRRAAKHLIIPILLVVLIVGTGGLVGGIVYAVQMPDHISEQDTLILGSSRLIPGAPATLHVQVQRHGNGLPIGGARVEVALQPREGTGSRLLFEGVTDAWGHVAAGFTVPEVADPAQQIVVTSRSELGRDTLAQPVTVERSFRVLLTTDKPVYQPGQRIQVRALVLGAFDRRAAAAAAVELTIADARGNKVYRQSATTSEYGVADWSFDLASEVNQGSYKISATLGDTTSETTVAVQPYVLPKFKVSTATDETFYRPGQHVTGKVEAAYFFGKPVDGGQVKLAGWVYDVERHQVLDLAGRTGPDGQFAFEFDLPDYFAGGVEGSVADYILEVAVIDGAAHTERVSLRIPVAQQGIIIQAVPESGTFKPGLENILYLLTAYPDGSPAECDVAVTLNAQSYQAHTGPYGLGELRVTPDSTYAELALQATDALGHTGEAHTVAAGQEWGSPVLLRPDRAVYRVGETMNLEVLTTESSGSVFLDITREGQTLSTRVLALLDGRAGAAIDLTPDLYGTLTLHAYRPFVSGDLARDTRLVVVDAPLDLDLAVRLDRDTYRPGETAALQVDVSGADGTGVQSTLGLAVVDESVFSLQEQDPGFAKLYFLLEKELLEPKFDLHGVTLPELMEGTGTAEPALRRAQDVAAQASLASIAAAPLGLSGSSHDVKAQMATQRQQQILRRMGAALYPVLIAVPLIAAGALLAALRRERVLRRSLALGIGVPIGLLLFAFAWLAVVPMPGAEWATTPMDKLSYLMDIAPAALVCVAGPALLGGLIGLFVLAVRAVRGHDRPLGLALLMLGSYAILLPLLMFVLAATNLDEPAPMAVIAFVAAYLALPLAFAARAAGFGLKRQGWALAASALVSVLAVMVAIGSLLAVPLTSVGLGAAPVAQDGNFLAVGEVMPAAAGGAKEGQAAPVPMPTQAPALEQASSDTGASGQDRETPLLRQFFPETMYWNPDAVTDAAGHWQADLDLAHTITTWRLTALASAQDGRLGSTTAPLRVFQDFFVDIDLPLALTQGDEVAMPVAVYNYLETGQQVQLTLEKQDWFTSRGDASQTVEVAPGDVTVVYFPIRVTATEGRFRPVVTAIGDKMSDATTLRHDVQVVPNGKRFDETFSDRLAGDVEQAISIPSDAIPGTAQIIVKVYPGILSQVVEGLEALLRMPSGCFEQTSSTTYPNVLVLDYVQSTGQVSPEVQMTAEQYVNLGYQRLTTFEVPGGGFSLFGQEPADRMLTAYGLMEFSDMAQVHSVDPAMIDRAAAWLLGQQSGDGSWENDQGLVHEQSWSSLGNERLPVTAYIVWALAEAGLGRESGTQKGLDYVREFNAQAKDPYALALVANALAAADPEGGTTRAVLDRLAGMAVLEGNGAYWKSDIATFMGATGQAGSIETTALAAYAFLRAGEHTELANQALTYLIRQKDSYGTWHSTQATVLTLKALILSVRKGGEGSDATVEVSLNGQEADPIRIGSDNFDVVQLVSWAEKPILGDNTVRIRVKGKGNLMYQVSSRYYLPWDKVPALPAGEGPIDLSVRYDRTELAVNDVIRVAVHVELKEGAARQAIVDLGIPPGFDVLTDDLADLVARDTDRPADAPRPKFSRFDITGRQIIIYLEGLKAGQPLDFTYRIRARYPIRAQTPPSSAYDYYSPGVSAVSAPAAIEVAP